MATDRTLLKAAQKGHVGSTGLSSAEDAVNQAHRQCFTFQFTDGGTAATNVTEFGFAVPAACKITQVQLTSAIAIAGHATNNKVITVSKRVAGAATAYAAFTLTVANAMTAHTPVTLTSSNATITNSAQALAAGDEITVKAIAAASGIAIGDATSYFTVTVWVEWI